MSTFLSPDSEKRPCFRFQVENVSNYTALQLSKDGRTLYVGAREALFALNSSVSFLPGGGYQEVRDDARGWLGWAEDGGGEDGQEDGPSGSKDDANREGRGAGRRAFHSRRHSPAPSRSPAAVERGCREETAVQLQGQGPTGELAPQGGLGCRRQGGW